MRAAVWGIPGEMRPQLSLTNWPDRLKSAHGLISMRPVSGGSIPRSRICRRYKCEHQIRRLMCFFQISAIRGYGISNVLDFCISMIYGHSMSVSSSVQPPSGSAGVYSSTSPGSRIYFISCSRPLRSPTICPRNPPRILSSRMPAGISTVAPRLVWARSDSPAATVMNSRLSMEPPLISIRPSFRKVPELFETLVDNTSE